MTRENKIILTHFDYIQWVIVMQHYGPSWPTKTSENTLKPNKNIKSNSCTRNQNLTNKVVIGAQRSSEKKFNDLIIQK